MKNRHHIDFICTLMLLLLWVPVSIDKVLNYEVFRASMIRQPFPDQWGVLLSYLLPALEALVVIALVFQRGRHYGFALSFVLLLAFSIYIGLALIGTWDKIPCGCGSVIAGLSWQQHFWFNMFFLGISASGLLLDYRKTATVKKEKEFF